MTSASVMAVLAGVFLATVALTRIARRLARRFGLLDEPNERSSHVTPTPRGGGIAIAVVTTLVLALLTITGRSSWTTFGVLGAGGIAVAAVGLVDDWRQLSTHVRLGVHLVAAAWAIILLGGMPSVRVGEHAMSFGWLGYPVGVLGIVWMLNLFNFMDGIDGIAASEGAFVAISAGVILSAGSGAVGVVAPAIVLGIACLGFLTLNWPPARIFLGDVGSGYLGYCIACLAIQAGHENAVAPLLFLILGSVFIVDATVTFIRRIARNERYDVGHRTHGYQRLAGRWGSHRPVTVAVLLVNVLVLLPAAIMAARHPGQAVWISAGVLMALLVGAVLVGSGRRG